MAELTVQGDELILTLSGAEKFEGLHSDITVPLASVRDVEVVSDAFSAVEGMRAPGTGIPGVLDVGTFRAPGVKSFVVIHHATPHGVRVLLDGQSFDELIVGCEKPDGVAAGLKASRRAIG